MANTYTWSISGLFAYPEMDGKSNVVFNVQWSCNGTDEKNNYSISGTEQLNYLTENNFIEYQNLDENIVIEWIKNSIGLERINQIYAEIDEILNAISNPPVINQSLPWVNNA
jgi:hypothetical protein